jgi:hypothetical protein
MEPDDSLRGLSHSESQILQINSQPSVRLDEVIEGPEHPRDPLLLLQRGKTQL